MPKELIIQAPQTGIAPSPHTGYGDVRNLDIESTPGIAKLNNILAKKSGSTVDAQVKWIVKNQASPANIYAIDSNGSVYNSSDSGGTWAELSDRTGAGQGLIVWKDYLFVAEDDALDVYGPLSGATFTVTIASPAVFTKTGHGLAANDTIIFSTTGALPTGLTAGTTYYVISAGLTTDAFEVSASEGGAAVNTSGTQSGVHTYKSWKTGWKTIDTDSDWHPLYTSKNDGKLYGGAGRYVFSIEELTNFVPGTSATYTFTQQALDLPEDYKIKSLAELGTYLECGTWQGTNVYDVKIADIFPWDRSSASFIEPIQINEHGVHGLLTVGNSMYVLAGTEGKIYRTNGSSAILVAQIPQSIADILGGKYLEWYPGAFVSYKGRVFFGVGGGGTSAIDGMGVWSLIETSAGTLLNLEHAISTLNYGASNVAKISALLPVTRDTILVGWRDNTTYGIDLTTATSYAYNTNYSAYFDSPLYRVGTPLNKKQYNELDIQLVRELAASEGVKVSFRENLTDSFTEIGTYDFALLGAVTSHNTKVNIPATEFLQIRVALNGSSTTTPNFQNIILR